MHLLDWDQSKYSYLCDLYCLHLFQFQCLSNDPPPPSFFQCSSDHSLPWVEASIPSQYLLMLILFSFEPVIILSRLYPFALLRQTHPLTFLFFFRHRQKYLETHMWWAWRVGANANFLMNIYYEHHWEQSIHDLRAQLNIEEPPKTPEKRKQI